MNRLIWAVSFMLIFSTASFSQTQKGAVGLDFYGSISHSGDDNKTVGNLSLTPNYLLTDRIRFGFGAAVSRDQCSNYETLFGVGGNVSYLFNLEPGKQKFIPLVGAGAGAGWGGGERVRVWSGSFGANYYINKSVGLSSGLSYQKNYPVSSRAKSSDSINFSWGLFVQFNSGN